MCTMFILRKNHPITNRSKILGFIGRLFFFLIFTSYLFCSPAMAAAKSAQLISIERQIIRLIPQGCVQLNDKSGNSVFSYRPEVLLIPASLIKILTAMVAFDELGERYRFKTEFYFNDIGELAIKGWGDPFLISEEITLITATLRAKGINKVGRIFLDVTTFQSDLKISGLSNSQNPYDALNGALAVNFNSLFIGRDDAGKVYSAEEVTPLTPLARLKGQMLTPGSEERINLTDQPDESLRYVGELFQAIFRKGGIQVKNLQISEIKVNESWQLLYTHYNSQDLTSIVKGLFRYSNNYIANQIFLTIGLNGEQPPAELDKSRRVFRRYLDLKYGKQIYGTVVDEASGISRGNRMSCKTMMQILEDFRKHASLIHPKKGIRVKSGTLTGIYNYAGYFESNRGLRPFVIMTENPVNQRDRVLRLIGRYFDIWHRHRSN